MKKEFIFNILMLLTMSTFIACSSSDDTTEAGDDDSIILLSGTDVQLTEDQQVLSQRANDFAFNLFRTANNLQKDNSNILLSPISAIYTLGMLNSGANGETAKEITSVLGFNNSNSKETNEFCKKIMNEIPNTDPNVILKVANYIAANNKYGLVFENQYEKDMRNYYSAELAMLDFTQSSDLSTIDNWCNTHTDGLISKMSEQITPSTRLAILNATYFKAAWVNKFNKKNTRSEVFYTEDGKQKEVEMMHQNFFGQYWQNDIYATLCMHYGAGYNWNMYILLPNKGKTTDDVINQLSKTNWENTHGFTRSSIVDTKLPKFVLNKEVDLKPIIEQMGAPIIFNDYAEFTKMFVNAKQLKVDKLIQKNLTLINEDGAEAAAVTIAGLKESSMGGSSNIEYQKVDFHCDRPFVYFIKESSSNTIFFIGTFRGE